MLQQQLRVGGLALATAVATATLALVTFLVTNLVLAVVAGLGGAVPRTSAEVAPPDGVQGVLVSGETGPRQKCRSLREPEVRGPTGLLARCHERRASEGPDRP